MASAAAEKKWPRLSQRGVLSTSTQPHESLVYQRGRLQRFRYDVGQQFDWHYDGCFERESGERSFLTFMVYLNQGFVGGETSFADLTSSPVLSGGKVVPRTGMALVFAHALLHKGEPVVEGRKYVLRTDVMYRRDK